MSAATATAANALVPGTWLGKHQLLHRLAVGGMAEIYLARATGIESFEKLLVLKRMLPQYADDHRFIRMFLDEARLAATFSHPNIAHVYDIGSGDGHYYFTMEHVHGEDLASVLEASRSAGRPVPLEHALTIVSGVAAGLHAAHDKRDAGGALLGVVHRDVSPSNVLVGYNGSVKLVDFGIARVASQHGKTRPGFLGKARYTSPEHVQGEPLDRRSDIFSLGIVLYELTTGARPFDGDGDFSVMQAIVHGEAPAPSRRVRDYPEALERIVLRALRRDRSERFSTAQDLQLAVEELARRSHLSLSSAALSTYMSELFAGKLAAWHEARRAGRTLTEHVIAAATGGTIDLAALAAPAGQLPAGQLPAGQLLSAEAERCVAAADRRPGARPRGWRAALGIALLGAALGVARAVTPAEGPDPGRVDASGASPPRAFDGAAHPQDATRDRESGTAPTSSVSRVIVRGRDTDTSTGEGALRAGMGGAALRAGASDDAVRAEIPVALPSRAEDTLTRGKALPQPARGAAAPARRGERGKRTTSRRAIVREPAGGPAQRATPWDPDSPLEP